MLVLIDRYAGRTPGANLNSFETPKDFMRKVAHAIDGRYGDPKACLTTVVQYWKNLTGGWRREGRETIRDEVVLSTSNVSDCSSSLCTSTRNSTVSHLVYQGPAAGTDGPGSTEAGKTLRYHAPLRLPWHTAVERLASIR